MVRYKETEMLKEINWADLRRKGWHGALMAGAAWIAVNPEYAWVTPLIAALAGQSQPVGFKLPGSS